MSFSNADVAHALAAIGVLLVAAQLGGVLFGKLKQPRVIGEILFGALLSSSLLGAWLPGLHARLFPSAGATPYVLGAFNQFGLLLLMFCSGLEVRAGFYRREWRTAAWITGIGTALPFAGALAFLGVAAGSLAHLRGPTGSPVVFAIVFGIAMTVTSIPVISRIMMELGILDTPFAGIVLGSAVLEDVLLYAALSVALALAGAAEGAPWGILGRAHLSVAGQAGYHAAVTLLFFAVCLWKGPSAFRWSSDYRHNALPQSSPVAALLLVMLALAGVCLYLGIAPMFGAFVAGIVAGASTGDRSGAREAINSFAFGFFVPLYFALVGFRLDLGKGFGPGFFVAFLIYACAVKAAGVYLGARLARESRRGAWNLAIAMNARGGPGIVLASVAYEAKIISAVFYTDLILLAVVTSLVAGSWLERVVRRGGELR